MTKETLVIKKHQLKLKFKEDLWTDPRLIDLIPNKFKPLTPVAVYDEAAAYGEQTGAFVYKNKVKFTLSTGDRIVLVYRDEDEAKEVFEKISSIPGREQNFLLNVLEKRFIALHGKVPAEATLDSELTFLDWGDPKFCLYVETRSFCFEQIPTLYQLLSKIERKDSKSLNLFEPMLIAVAEEFCLVKIADMIKDGLSCEVYGDVKRMLEKASVRELEYYVSSLEQSLIPIVAFAKAVLDTLRD